MEIPLTLESPWCARKCDMADDMNMHVFNASLTFIFYFKCLSIWDQINVPYSDRDVIVWPQAIFLKIIIKQYKHLLEDHL